MIERHQDYQLSLPTVPAGGLFQVPLQLDTDAPFALRRVKSRNLGISGFRFRTARDQYQSPGFRTDLIDDGTGNLSPSQGVRIYPELTYPVNGTIVVDVANNTGQALQNVRILFRGSKLFRDGQIPAPTYPPKLSTLPFTYQVIAQNLGVTGNSQAVPGLNCAVLADNLLNIRSDADFACRYLCADPFAMAVDGGPNPPPQSFTEAYVMLRDESRKAYSNEPIHICDLFTQGAPSTAGAFTNNLPNRFFPGLLTPEIYLEKEGTLYFDLFRDDSALANQFPVSIYFRFQGAKVFKR
jgi:hypothetical protein